SRAPIVVSVNTKLDVIDKQVRQFLHGYPFRPMTLRIELCQMKPGWTENVNPGAAGYLREFFCVAAAVARHRIDHRPSAGTMEIAQFSSALLNIIDKKIRPFPSRVAPFDNDVFVRVTNA